MVSQEEIITESQQQIDLEQHNLVHRLRGILGFQRNTLWQGHFLWTFKHVSYETNEKGQFIFR